MRIKEAVNVADLRVGDIAIIMGNYPDPDFDYDMEFTVVRVDSMGKKGPRVQWMDSCYADAGFVQDNHSWTLDKENWVVCAWEPFEMTQEKWDVVKELIFGFKARFKTKYENMVSSFLDDCTQSAVSRSE